MKKSVLIIFSFLLISFISALYVDNYDYNFYSYNNEHFVNNEYRQNSKTFHITHGNGQSYYRTFTNYNKYKKDYDYSKTDFERKGIYLDFFDTEDKQNLINQRIFKNIETEKEMNCPKGWTCKK